MPNLDLRTLIEFIIKTTEIWALSISNPKQFLTLGFLPTEEEIFDGVEFLVTMFLISLVLSLPVAFRHGGDFGEKTRLAANAIFGWIVTGLMAMICYFPFWLLGGASNFSGTFLGYVYAMSPYLPMYSICGLIVVAGLPARFRPYATNPATSQQAIMLAMQDPATTRGMVIVGGWLTLGLLFWSTVVLFRSLGYIHDLHGWRFSGAVLVSLVVASPVGIIIPRVSSLLSPPLPSVDQTQLLP